MRNWSFIINKIRLRADLKLKPITKIWFVDKIVVVVLKYVNMQLLKTIRWINIMKSTGYFIKKPQSLRKRRVLRKDIYIQFSTALFLSTQALFVILTHFVSLQLYFVSLSYLTIYIMKRKKSFNLLLFYSIVFMAFIKPILPCW